MGSEVGSREKVITLKGDLSIERANEIREILLGALHDADRIVVDLGKVTEMDLSFLQLLCSAHRTSIKQNKQLRLKGEGMEVFLRVAKEAGYLRTVGCEQDSDKRDFCCGQEVGSYEQDHNDGR